MKWIKTNGHKTLWLIFCFSILFISIAYAQPTVVRFSHVVSPESPKGKAIQYFKKELERLTAGDMTVQIHPSGILFNDTAAIRAVQKNIIQMAAPSFSKFTGLIDDFQVFDIPYLFESIEEVHLAYYGKVGTLLKAQAEKNELVILSFWDNGFKQITNNIRPVKMPTDMDGLTFRTMGSHVINRQFDLIGAKAYAYPFSKLKSIISEGVIDGQENTFSNIYTQQIHHYQQYMTVSGHGYLGYAVIVSKLFWDQLSISQQKKFQYVLNRATQYEMALAKDVNLNDFYRIRHEAPTMQIYRLNLEEKTAWSLFFSQYYQQFYGSISSEIIEEAQRLKLF